ncbi:unnamed protein product [Sphagnum troendelagicum]|uniref:Myb-like domain-containing protein n=1 Tax=Sphagnum troendelagicum TaxID=128251 RepID=A0ABP0UDW6_9BRYO
MAQLVLSEEERVVDQELGYPRCYGKLCRRAFSGADVGFFTPFIAGPPQRFVPYSPPAEDLAKLKEWDTVFPAVAEVEKEAPNAHKHAEGLWEQLDHLGNAGFDPAKFRVDKYGNVLYWSADPSSPLSWEVDHWFPLSRGGRTLASNLQIVQWQARQRKKNRLEFLVPWWDLQHGVSINQFLSAFASKNAEFRRRSFALFFAGGEDENIVRQHVGDCGPWPPQFREKKIHCGLAGAAIVSIAKDNDQATVLLSSNCSVQTAASNSELASVPGTTLLRRIWSVEEEDALKRAVQRFGTGSWKEIKESEPSLMNRSIVQIREKERSMRGDRQFGKENNSTAWCRDYDRQTGITNAMQKELRLKVIREEGKQEKSEEILQLEETVQTLKEQNEKERLALVELEGVLSKQKQRIEKQRRWAETQSSYRLCLERMIRDTMHQSISYKEQARLNQAACNALMARLDCQKMTCETAEKDLLQRYSQRQALAALASSEFIGTDHNKSLKGRDIVDVSSCLSLVTTSEGQVLSPDKELLEQDTIGLCSESEDGDIANAHRTNVNRCGSVDPMKAQQKQEHFEETHSGNAGGLQNDAGPRKEIAAPPTLSQEEKILAPLQSFDLSAQAQCSSLKNTKQGIQEEEGHDTDGLKLQECHKFHEVHEAEVTEPQASDNEKDLAKNFSYVKKTECSNSSHGFQEKPLDPLLECSEKDVIMVETTTSMQAERYSNADPQSNGNLADSQASTTSAMETTYHHNKLEAAAHEDEFITSENERIHEIGKSNLDKWLHVLFEDAGSPRMSTDDASQIQPAHNSISGQQPPLSPALSNISMAALRGSIELDGGRDNHEFLRKDDATSKSKRRWGGLMRKLSVKHLDELYEEEPPSPQRDNRNNLRNALKSFEDFKMNGDIQEKQEDDVVVHGSSEGADNKSSAIQSNPELAKPTKGGGAADDNKQLKSSKSIWDNHVNSNNAGSDSWELMSKMGAEVEGDDKGHEECENIESSTNQYSQLFMDSKDGAAAAASKHRIRASLKACTLKWRKAVRKHESKPSLDGCASLQVNPLIPKPEVITLP